MSRPHIFDQIMNHLSNEDKTELLKYITITDKTHGAGFPIKDNMIQLGNGQIRSITRIVGATTHSGKKQPTEIVAPKNKKQPIAEATEATDELYIVDLENSKKKW